MTSVFLHFLNLSITAGWMVLAVLLLRLCLKKAPRWITCVLWGLVALRLILPFTIESPISLIPTAQTVVSTEGSDDTTPVVDSGLSAIDKPLNDWLQAPVETPVEKPSQSPIVQSPVPQTPPSSDVVIDGDKVEPKPDDVKPVEPTPDEQKPSEQPSSPAVKTVSRMEKILNVVAPIWLVGIGLMLAYELFSVIRVRRRVLDAVRLRDNIWQSDRVSSPFIFGLFRPRIYIPYGLEEPVLEQVLSHERAHLHRRDHWIKPFAFTLLAVYWYNPLLWVCYILLCRDIEVACDERVVRSLDEDTRRQYATALLQCGVERRSIAACPLAFGEVSIKQRIKSVLNYRKPLLWVIIASLVVCAVAAMCLLTVPKSKPADSKPKDSSTEEEEPIVVLSSKVIKPDQVRQFFSQDTDGALVEAGCNWMWEHAENPDQQTLDIEYWEETNVPLVVSHSKADLDALMDACSDDEWDQVDMRYWFELEKYDDAYFEDKVIVWLHVPGYSLGYYDYTVTLEETNKGLRYAVSVEYESTSMFNPWTNICEYLLLFETDRKLIEEAKTLTTRHEQAPYELPTELTMLSVGSADVDGDGEAEDIRLYHSALEWSIGGELGYETAYLVVCKKDGTPILRECTLINTHSQCYLVPQEDGTCLLLLLEAGDLEYAYSDEEFGVLSLKDGVRTVLDNKYESMHPTGWNGISFGTLAPYALTLSDWLENAQLLYECDNGTIRYGADVTAQYQPLCWLDEYRNSDDDTLQDILETILASLGGETVSCGEMDFDNDGDNETLSVLRYVDEDGIYQHNVLVVRKADGIILTAAQIHYDYVNETRGLGSYVYWIKTENGYVLKRADRSPYTEGLSVYELSIDGMTYVDDMATEEWLDYVEAHDSELLFYFQGLEMHFPNEDTSDNYLNEDATKYAVENYNPSIVAYNAFLKGQRVAHEYGELDTMFYVSDLYADASESVKGVQRYTLADVTGDGVPELITEGYTMSVFTYQSGRVLRLYESSAGMFPTLLSNGCLWEWRMGGGGNTYRYTSFFEIGTTRTVQFGRPDNPEDQYYVDDVWMNKADFDAKTSTYFANAQSPALLIWYDYATKQPDSPAMVQYLSLLQEQYLDYRGAYYTLYDLNGDGEEELLIQDGTKLLVYTQGDNSAQLLVEQDFVGGTSRFLTTGDADYPGLIYFCVGGGKNQYYYLTLDNVQDKKFVKIPLWTDNYGFYEEGEEGRITELSDDKRLIELSRQVYQNNRDLAFSLYGGSTSTIALDRKYQQALHAYSSDSKSHRDVDALQPETMDIIQIDGKYYQTYVSGAVDMRYIWLSQYEADIGIASWDWVPIGTEDDYSLSNIGKIDDGQKGEGMVLITYSTSENATLQELQQSCDILEQRLTAMGMSGYRISITEDQTILLEVPRSYYPGNLNKRAYLWGSQGEFAVCIGDTEDGIVPMPPEDTVLDYRHIESAEAVMLQDGEYAVALTFTAEGADLLADITTELAKTKDYLYVHMDWEFYDTLQVLQPITDGECVVDDFASWEAAALFAAQLNAGILPYNYAADVDFSLVE